MAANISTHVCFTSCVLLELCVAVVPFSLEKRMKHGEASSERSSLMTGCEPSSGVRRGVVLILSHHEEKRRGRMDENEGRDRKQARVRRHGYRLLGERARRARPHIRYKSRTKILRSVTPARGRRFQLVLTTSV